MTKLGKALISALKEAKLELGEVTAERDQLKTKLEKAIKILELIDRWWDASDPSRVVPAIDNPEDHGIIRVRNDSMAAGSIIFAKYALKEIKGNPTDTEDKK